MMHNMGTDSITAIEANSNFYLKCLIVKELFNLDRATFLYGNIMEYLSNTNEKYDICLASAVLYHMANPILLIKLISKITDKVLIWTRYYHKETFEKNRLKKALVSEHLQDGLKFKLYTFGYGLWILSKSFCGGNRGFFSLMEKEDIIAALKHYGFTNIKINFDEMIPKHGPGVSIYARR